METSFEHFIIPDDELSSIDLKTCININIGTFIFLFCHHNKSIGVMGHIDSGKTSLSRALTKITSTAALDKNPQSKERGITLDLGFSAFFTKFPSHRFPESKIKVSSVHSCRLPRTCFTHKNHHRWRINY